MLQRISRRRLLAAATVTVAGWATHGGWARGDSPNERLHLALIGCGGRGEANLKGVEGENFVALCDVDEERASNAWNLYPNLRKFSDYRRLFDEMHRQMDAVVVSTPDHTHAAISLMAMRLGKHVYCETPLSWSIAEARQMAETARRYQVATQLGTAGMAEAGTRTAIEVVQSGVLGQVRQIHGWTDRPLWPQGIDRPEGKPPVPTSLKWDLWLGPAPERPYHPAYVPFKWRGWFDFGTGTLGAAGIEILAMACRALRLGLPTTVEPVELVGRAAESFPAGSVVRFQFPARGERAPVALFWYDGGRWPPAALVGNRPLAKNGVLLVGDQATLYSAEGRGDWHLWPEEKFRDYRPPSPTLPRSAGPYAEWLTACKGGPAAFCNFPDYAAGLTETLLVGNLAVRSGQKITWDAAAMQATNCPAAEPWIRRPYRAGWEL